MAAELMPSSERTVGVKSTMSASGIENTPFMVGPKNIMGTRVTG
jgi:hypothetical protein